MFTDAEWDKLAHYTPLPPPPPSSTNRYADDPAAAALGQRLWFERRYAGAIIEGTLEEGGLGAVGETQKVACADCHDATRWFTDTRSIPNRTALGTMRMKRNSPSIVNVAYYEWIGWGGGHDQLWKQAATVYENRDSFNSTRLAYAHVIYAYYRDDYDALFPTPIDPALDPADTSGRFPPSGKPGDAAWDGMQAGDRDVVNTVVTNCGKAIEAYERQLVSRDAPFDRYVAGDPAALSESAKRGLKLFVGKAACATCHDGPTFTDQKFHNTGVSQVVADRGHFDDVLKLSNPLNGAGAFSDDPAAGAAKLSGVAQAPDQTGAFRTKSLRHLTETGPYFHNGSAATLEDVVQFYNRGGGDADTYPGVKDSMIVPLNLTDGEVADLVEFLASLTGAPVPAALTQDTAALAPVR